jgi:hypothetical protein
MEFRSLITVAVLLTCSLPPAVARDSDEDVHFFEARVRPVLFEHCYPCHSARAEKLKAGLRLDSRSNMLQGGETGPAIVPEQPDQSLLIRAISYQDPDLQMPPRSRLSPAIIEDFRHWIRRGAIWPHAGPVSSNRPAGFDLEARRARHWAWHPVRRPPVPIGAFPESEPITDIDRFLLARLSVAGIKPSPVAPPRVLFRRASFALTGLPPTPAEVRAFLDDDHPDAWARAIDRLLASPHFGERWARHWLDKVRYAETMGHEFDYAVLGAWRYRDYVVDAFNADVPYDQFAREQMAGDLLPRPRLHPENGTNASLLGTLQFWFAQQVHSPVDVRQHQSELIDNQIDVVTKAFLALTVSCARCHDHKFDAISTRDYYALHGILSSSRPSIRAVDNPHARRTKGREIIALRDRARRALAAELLEAFADDPEKSLPTPETSGRIVLRSDERRLCLDDGFAAGEAFSFDAAPAAQPVISDSGPVRLVRPGWLDSGSLAPQFQGTFQTATFTLEDRFIHIRLAGQGSRFSLALEGFTLIRSPIYGSLRRAVRDGKPHWVTLDAAMWKGRHAWLEFTDISAPDPASELPESARSPLGWIAVGDVVISPHPTPPALEPVVPPADHRRIIELWRDAPDQLSPDQILWLAAAIETRQLNPRPDLATEWAAVACSIQPPVLAGVISEGTGIDEPVFIRGNHRTPGAPVPRRFLEAISSGPGPAEYKKGSGRLALARAISHPENPLFARVAVNWVWSHLFGRGLVASVDNFGELGEAPTHPELLDWLADEFRSNGWSIKGLIRQIMVSRAWRMSSRVRHPHAEILDPDNRLLHRAHLRRLEGEVIRDAMLTLGGNMDPALGGPSVPVHLTPFMDGRGRPSESGPMDGLGRRSLYLEVRRNFLSPFMLAFDTPAPATTVGRRSVSNVPAQALALMNDPFVAAQAGRWAARIPRSEPVQIRIGHLYEEAFSRPPTPEESEAAEAFVESIRAADGEHAAWTALCHALLNAKEFVFIE